MIVYRPLTTKRGWVEEAAVIGVVAGIGMGVWATVSVGTAVLIGRAITLADAHHLTTADEYR